MTLVRGRLARLLQPTSCRFGSQWLRRSVRKYQRNGRVRSVPTIASYAWTMRRLAVDTALSFATLVRPARDQIFHRTVELKLAIAFSNLCTTRCLRPIECRTRHRWLRKDDC